MTLIQQPEGNYSFLPLSVPNYSAGVRADTGYQIVHATLQVPLPYLQGFALVEQHLAAIGRPRAALCGIELRCAVPYTEAQWVAPDGFNARYADLLRGWGLFIGQHNPVARTNVAPTADPPSEQVLYAFSYTVRSPHAAAAFVVSGAGESPIVRPGETSPEALYDKTLDVLAALQGRLEGLGMAWDQVTTCDLYTAHDLHALIGAEMLPRLGAAAVHGVHLYPSRPPIDNLEVEMDCRGVWQELRLPQA